MIGAAKQDEGARARTRAVPSRPQGGAAPGFGARASRLCRGLLTVLVAAFLLAPSFDFACAAEGLSPAAATSVVQVAAAAGEATAPAAERSHAEKGGVCPHGHCHQGAATALQPDPRSTLMRAAPVRHVVPSAHLLASTAPALLDRPPRL